MKIHKPFGRRGLLFAIVAALGTHSAVAQGQNEHWVATWATAHRAAPPVVSPVVGQTFTAAQQAQLGFNNQTIRMIAPVSIGGRRVRVQFSNAYGTTPLKLGAVHVALRAKDSAIAAGSDRALTFSGQPSFTIPPGASALSDPVDLDVPPLGELAVSVYVPEAAGPPTIHTAGLHTTYISKSGDATAQPAIEDGITTQSWYWLSSIQVLAPADASTSVAFGDSITDGARSTPDADRSWPSRLARRLVANRDTARIAIVNQGIGGNRILRDNTGPNALARFDEDVLSPAGVKWLIVLEGINDIGQGARANALPENAVTAAELIAADRQMIARAHLRGIKVMGATLTPYGGAAYSSEKGEAIRDAVNTWIRTGGAFDAVVDFEAATRDPKNPKQFRPEFDSGDHLHPSDAGYQAMADAIDLAVFGSKTVSSASTTR
jgi:lysophospholipase L1-like esterase